MKTTLITLCVALLMGCSKKDDPQGQYVYDLGVNISLKNAAGDDLLDPNNPNAYKIENIKTYHLINGEEKSADADNVISQDGNGNGNYIFTTFVNYEGSDEYPITYIDWSPTDRDTIKAEIYKNEYQTRAIKIWYNGELKWDVEDGDGPTFTILK